MKKSPNHLLNPRKLNWLAALPLRVRVVDVCHILMILLWLTVAGCSKPAAEVTEPSISKSTQDISLSSDKVYLSEVSGQYAVVATLVDGSGVAFLEQPPLEWSSSSASVATVDSSGVITATGMGEAQITVKTGNISKSISVIVNSGIVTLRGQVRYEDREYDAAGFNTNTAYYKSARFVKIDLLSPDNKVVQTAYSDAQGQFSFTGLINSQQKISVYSSTDAQQGLDLSVQDRSGSLYAVSSAVVLDNNNFMAINIPLSVDAAAAFNVLDVLTNAANFAMAHSDLILINLAAFWEKNNPDGTYYCNGYDSFYCDQGKGIYVHNSVGTDTDEFDDDVLYHEFGHFFLGTLSRDDSLGGCHLLSSRDLDLRLSWSEGFGDFFPAAIKAWLGKNTDTVGLLSSASDLPYTAYVDTYQTRAQISIDLKTLDSRYMSAGNEMAIARVLFNLSERFGMRALVSVLEQYLSAVNTPTNLEAFWDGWLSVQQPSAESLLELESIFNERKIYYQLDALENDNAVAGLNRNLLAKNTLETHYLYAPVNSGFDTDVIPFNVSTGKQYVVQTTNLTSGADTHISILDSAGNVLKINGASVVNDDQTENAYYSYDSVCGGSRVKNNGTALASSVSFTAPETGIYYAAVRTTTDADPYLSAGRYGTYDLLMQEY